MTLEKELPAGWERIDLSKLIIENPKSKFLVRDSKNIGKYPFFTSGETLNMFDDFLVDGPNIFIATGGKANIKFNIGKSAYSSDTWSITNNDLSNIKYIYYFLINRLQYINDNLFYGAGLKHLNKKQFRSIQIPLPPLEVQERIVEILDKGERLKELRKESIKKSKELVKSIFHIEYIKKLDNVELLNWRKVSLGEICDVRDGTHDSPRFINNGFPLVYSKNLKNGTIDFSTTKNISEKDYLDINKRSKVDNGDILLAMIGTIGRAIIVNKERDFAIKNVGLIKKNKFINNHFLLSLLESSLFKTYVSNIQLGTTQKFLGLGNLRNFSFFIPSLDEQNKIVKKLDFLNSISINLDSSNKKLSEFNSSLLQKAFNGEL